MTLATNRTNCQSDEARRIASGEARRATRAKPLNARLRDAYNGVVLSANMNVGLASFECEGAKAIADWWATAELALTDKLDRRNPGALTPAEARRVWNALVSEYGRIWGQAPKVRF
jgi:hypothetical protein